VFVFIQFLSPGEDGIDKSPDLFRCNLNRIQERLGFLFQLLIVFVQFFKTVFPYLCVFICLLEFLLVFQLLRLFRKAADRIIL